MEKVNFKELSIDTKIIKAIEEMGYETPTEIQAKAIPVLLKTEGDFIGQAQTGTGKTAAFAIPLLEKIQYNQSTVQVLVLAPTRELAQQVENEIKKFGKYTDVKTCCVYGGTSYEKQIRSLKKDKPHIVVGTPGRVKDMMNRGILKVHEASFCVLDEADEMLNMGFLDDIQEILDAFNEQRQLVMFSATMPQGILNLIKKSFRNYEMVKIEKTAMSSVNITQKYFVVNERNFLDALTRLIDQAQDIYGIVFCKTRSETNQVGDQLKGRGYGVEILNGDKSQAERERAMRNFKQKKVDLLVCTDVAARGIDITNLTHVFNYGLPQDFESYVHRIGRTGRAGLKGMAYTLVGPRGVGMLRRIEKYTKGQIELGEIPSTNDLKKSYIKNDIEALKEHLNNPEKNKHIFSNEIFFNEFSQAFVDASSEDLLKLLFIEKFKQHFESFDRLKDIKTNEVPVDDKPYGRNRGGGRSRFSKGGRGPARDGRDKKSSFRDRKPSDNKTSFKPKRAGSEGFSKSNTKKDDGGFKPSFKKSAPATGKRRIVKSKGPKS